MDNEKIRLRAASPYNGALTREQYLFYEMRTICQLHREGYSDVEIIEKVYRENLFQYPTDRSLKRLARACLRRLHILEDEDLIAALAEGAPVLARQVCLYAYMKQFRLVRDFMVNVIGEKFRQRDYYFSRLEVSQFFLHLQEQDASVATWSEQTIAKLKQVLVKLLVDNEYLDNTKATTLNCVTIEPELDNALRALGDTQALAAFNVLI